AARLKTEHWKFPDAGTLAGHSRTFTGAARPLPVARPWSGKSRRCARLRGGTGTGHGRIERTFMPDHRGSPAVAGEDGRGLRRVNRRAAMQRAAEAAAAPQRVLPARLVVLAGASLTIAMADRGHAEGIGSGDACSPTRRDRRENLHRQGNQDYGQKLL